MMGKRLFVVLAVGALLGLQLVDCMSAMTQDQQSMKCCGSMPCDPSNQSHDCCKGMVSSQSPNVLPVAHVTLYAPVLVVTDILASPQAMLRGTALPAAKQEYRSQPARAHRASRERRATHWVTETKPSPCSNRDSDWTDRRAWNRSTSYSVGLASSRTCSPQVAGPTVRPRPKLQIVSCPSC